MPINQQKQLSKQDPHSYAEPEKVVVSHLDLELNPNFQTQRVSGVAELSLDWRDTNADELVLDTRKITIEKIEALNEDGSFSKVNFQLDDEDAILGSALHINVNSTNKKVRITYQTAKNADGLQWLNPTQTASKTHPYLYSHSEPIMARSWIPIQDTPSVRQSYNAIINTPKELRAVMSAENDPNAKLNGRFEFNMPQKIPSYLIAFAVGNIRAERTGPRSTVYSEPGIVNAAAKEFEDTEQMIQTAEKLYGPYRWGTYDILVLPPAFTLGGMENPRLTFATPTVIAGDKSLVSLVAHELAHSWSGNLVTNASWRHVWLNEGFTTYVSYRIVEEIYGKEEADQQFIMDANDLKSGLAEISEADQRLVGDFAGRNPRETMGDIAYNKGAWFLKTLEEKFGREAFDNFLREYFDHFAFQSNTTDKFEEFLEANLVNKYPGKYSMQQVNQWIHQAGIPEDAAKADSKRFEQNDIVRQKWLDGKITAFEMQANKWTSTEWQYFFNHLPAKLSYAQAKELDQTYSLTGMNNHVVAASWYKIAIASEYKDAYPAIREHLSTIGRRLLVGSLYSALMKTDEGKSFAQDVYKSARSTYHSVTRDWIDKVFTDASVKILTPEQQQPILKNLQSANLAQFNPVKKIASEEQQADVERELVLKS